MTNNFPHMFFTGDLDKVVKNKFKNCYMSDSKWDRLISKLTDEFNLHINYKLIHDEAIYSTCITFEDDKPYFEEPVIYKEVEWIEWPRFYKSYVNDNNRKAGVKSFEQDLNLIEREINKVGQFNLQKQTESLKLIAYD